MAEAFCGVWLWAEKHIERIEAARIEFDERRMTRRESPA